MAESPPIVEEWIKQQDLLQRRVIVGDDFSWTWGADGDFPLRFVGGVDVSCDKDDSSIACGALVVVDVLQRLPRGEAGGGPPVIYETHEIVRLSVPYVSGFLAFREAPVLLRLLEKMKRESPSFYPQVLMVDGNGVLHPKGFGLACHLGVLANLPTIGIGKNLHHFDGITMSGVRALLQGLDELSKGVVTLVGESGRTLGAAMRSSTGSSKPIFISVGHRLSLDSCISIVNMCCMYRVPEPIRQADIRSRQHIRSTLQRLHEYESDITSL
ncbi:endonuclease V family protein [Wolffia australiana]